MCWGALFQTRHRKEEVPALAGAVLARGVGVRQETGKLAQ